MKFAKQHPKVFICLLILVLAAAGALIVREIPGEEDCDYTQHGIRYSASVGGLEYDSPDTKSYHRISVENDADFDVELEYRFVHFVFMDDRTTIARGEDDELKHKVIEVEEGPILETGESHEDSEWIEIYVGDLDTGWYWINAYTELEVKQPGPDLTPRAEEWLRVHIIN